MIRAAFTIAGREIRRRLGTVAIATVTMAIAVAICVATDFLALSREIAVATELDRMGPGLVVLPPGADSLDLARHTLSGPMLPSGIMDTTRGELDGRVRAVDGRQLLQVAVDGIRVRITGVDANSVVDQRSTLSKLRGRRVVLGAVISGLLGKSPGDRIEIGGHSFEVAGVLPRLNSGDDEVLYMPLAQLPLVGGFANAVNVLYIYPLPSEDRHQIRYDLSSLYPDLNVVTIADENGTRESIEIGLGEHRTALYAITGSLAILVIMVWAILDSEDRRRELATFIAIGGSTRLIFAIMASRALILALAAALLGTIVGMGLAMANGIPASGLGSLSPDRFLAWTLFAAIISLAGALPAAWRVATRDPIVELGN